MGTFRAVRTAAGPHASLDMGYNGPSAENCMRLWADARITRKPLVDTTRIERQRRSTFYPQAIHQRIMEEKKWRE